jgi:hypothetical protein
MYTLYDLIAWSVLAGLIAYWWHASGVKAQALLTARRHCQDRGLQFLDDTLAFKGFRLLRHPNRSPRLLRLYEFDFCTNGIDRFKGLIELSDRVVHRIVLETSQLEITNFP